jgi:hypothetical protein
MSSTRSEQECGAISSVLAEDRKHRSLVFVRQVKEAVPSNEPLKPTVHRQRAHIGNDPFLVRKARAAFCDKRRRRVDADNGEAVIEEVSRDGLSGATTDIKDRAPRRKKSQEALHPLPLDGEITSTIAIPSMRMSFIQPNYFINA